MRYIIMNFRDKQRLNKRKIKDKKGYELRGKYVDWEYGTFQVFMFNKDSYKVHIQGESYLD